MSEGINRPNDPSATAPKGQRQKQQAGYNVQGGAAGVAKGSDMTDHDQGGDPDMQDAELTGDTTDR